MSDVVERLRSTADMFELADAPRHTVLHMRAAADEITALRAEVERLRAALALFACDCTVNERCAVPDNCRNFQARRTLGERT